MQGNRYRKQFSIGIAAALWILTSSVLQGQGTQPSATFSAVSRSAMVEETRDLPDEPQAQAGTFSFSSGDGQAALPGGTRRHAPQPVAPLYNKYIDPGQQALPLLSVNQKLRFGVHQIASPYFLLAVVGAAEYEQVLDESPNYGSNGKAFAQRMGAAAVRNASQSLFTDGLMPALLHEDPRYYVLGQGHKTLARTAYAVTRVFVTRSDDGRDVPNYSLFTGHAETVLLQNAYYPDVNRNLRENVEGYADSFAGTALSNVVREFFPDLLHLVHLE